MLLSDATLELESFLPRFWMIQQCPKPPTVALCSAQLQAGDHSENLPVFLPTLAPLRACRLQHTQRRRFPSPLHQGHILSHVPGPTHSSSGMDPQRSAQVPPLLLPAGEGSHLPLKGGGLSHCLSPGSSPAFCSSPRRRNADIADLMVCFTVLMLLSNCCWELLIH